MRKPRYFDEALTKSVTEKVKSQGLVCHRAWGSFALVGLKDKSRAALMDPHDLTAQATWHTWNWAARLYSENCKKAAGVS